jgi:hypothetical protein
VNRHPEAIGLLHLAPGCSVEVEGKGEREQGVLLAGVHQKKNA